MAIYARAGEPPHPADRGQAVRFAADRRDGAAHGVRLRRAKGRLASSRAIFSFSRARSISAAPSLAFSRSLSSASPVAARLVRAASPPARKASCQPLRVAAVMPNTTVAFLRRSCDLLPGGRERMDERCIDRGDAGALGGIAAGGEGADAAVVHAGTGGGLGGPVS